MTKLNQVKQWHKNKISWFQDATNMTDYQMWWAAFIKGVIITAIIL